MTSHPLVRHYLTTGDRHTRIQQDADRFRGTPATEAFLARMRVEGFAYTLLIPAPPASHFTHRWFAVARDSPYTDAERAFGERVRPLIAGLLQHAAALRTCYERSGRPPPAQAAADAVRLSARELAVLELLAQGFTTRRIARQLCLAPGTIAKHQEHIYRKLGVQDRLSAFLRAQSIGLLAAGDGTGHVGTF